MTLLNKKFTVQKLLDSAKNKISKEFYEYILTELEQAKTERAFDLIKAIVSGHLQNAADELFWEILKKLFLE